MSDFKLEIQKPGVPEVWMFGGGTQSCYIAALIARGELPAPDYALIADTGREKKSTFEYLRDVVQPALPFEIKIIPKHVYATVDLWGGADGESLLIPAYTNESGQISKLDTYCSNEWKTRVCERFLRGVGVKSFRKWIGFSVDEPTRYLRMRKSQGDRVRFPLVDDIATTREQCVAGVEAFGWPTPEWSACWCCPNMRDVEWAALTPEEFEKACVLDAEIRKRDPHVFLHKSCVALRDVKFSKEQEQPRPCESGVCFN